ncbi:hypothetical protein IF2G_03166 [Cordyceps javanica]|nr:hypothetical protein IF2G_03166 [Cordyceps javanica]
MYARWFGPWGCIRHWVAFLCPTIAWLGRSASIVRGYKHCFSGFFSPSFSLALVSIICAWFAFAIFDSFLDLLLTVANDIFPAALSRAGCTCLLNRSFIRQFDGTMNRARRSFFFNKTKKIQEIESCRQKKKQQQKKTWYSPLGLAATRKKIVLEPISTGSDRWDGCHALLELRAAEAEAAEAQNQAQCTMHTPPPLRLVVTLVLSVLILLIFTPTTNKITIHTPPFPGHPRHAHISSESLDTKYIFALVELPPLSLVSVP